MRNIVSDLAKLHTNPGVRAKLIEFLKSDREVARDTVPGTRCVRVRTVMTPFPKGH